MQVSFVNDKNNRGSFKNKFNQLVNKVKAWKIPSAFYYFLLLLGIGVGFYFVMLAENHFSLAYGGDYTAQYIPMGYHIWDYYHEWMWTGHFTLFDPTVYLGVNSIGSNAYYGLFSPFNLIIVIFPRHFVPQALAVCSIVKLACAGLFFSMYMKRAFGVKDIVARACGIAYGFAGWGAFYLWYNNYQDILVFFPLVLLGIEKVLKEYKPWILCTGVFFLAICNYVLTVPYLICGFIYAMFRFFQGMRKKSFKENMLTLGFGFIGFAGGLLMSLFVFGPAVMATMASPKLDSYSYFGTLKEYLTSGKLKEFFELLFSWKVAPDQHGNRLPKRVFYPIIEFFFPATTCRSLPTLELQSWDFDDMAVSLWCYMPFIMFLVPALIQSGKDKKYSHFIALGLIVLSLFTPFMYYVTMGGTNGYARWTLFIATSLIAYVGIYIDKIPDVAKWHIHIGFLFALAGIIAAWVLTFQLTDPNTGTYGKYMHRFVEDGQDFTNLAFLVELIYTIGVYLTLFFMYNRKQFHMLTVIFVSFEAVVMGNFVTWGHGYDQGYNNGYSANERFKKLYDSVAKNDKSYYRVYTSIGDDWSVNNSLMNNYNAAGFFHSLYNFEVDDFTLWTGMRSDSKSVGGNYRGKHQDLDNMLGVKYYFISKKKSKFNDIGEHYVANVPFDYDEKVAESNEYLVYKNTHMNAFGNAYSNLYTGELSKTSRWSKDVIDNEIVLTTKAAVSEKDAQEITSKYDGIYFNNIKPSSTLKALNDTNDFNHDYYDIWSQTENHIPAKSLSFDKISTIPDDFAYGDYIRFDEEGRNKAQHYYTFFYSKTAGEPLFRAGTSLYVKAPFSPSEKFDFYFMDQNRNIFMYDMHDDDTTDNTSMMRGFYLRNDAYYLAVCGKYDKSFIIGEYGGFNISFYTEDKSDYEARRDAMLGGAVENVTYKKDRFAFTSNNTENKFIVSRVAYDKGWKISAFNNETKKSEDIKVYKGNGGFVSFVAPKGDYKYTMTYKTPGLTLSYLVTAFSVTSFFVSMVGYHYLQEKKRKHYLDNIYREN